MSPDLLACWNRMAHGAQAGRDVRREAEAWGREHERPDVAAEALRLWEATAQCDDPPPPAVGAALRRLLDRAREED